jgi:mono/diheme cytochrome c family protein
MRQALGACFCALLVLLAVRVPAKTTESNGARSAAAHDPITTKVTFAREIRAILAARCAVCHAPGGSAPMALTTYEEVRPWARAIKDQVLTRRMPMWHAARGFGAFKNDPSLTPIELAMIAAWVDGGLPYSASSPRAPSASASSTLAASTFRRKIGVPAVRVPAGATEGAGIVPARWVTAWSFEPGDPLITSATFSAADGTVVGNCVAGDEAVVLPSTSAIRVTSPLRVRVERRVPADYERPYKSRASVLRLATLDKAPARRVWTEQTSCGTPRAGRNAELVAIRPMLDAGGSARIWLERPGAPRTIVGWFRDFDPRVPRTYWLARPGDFPIDARLQGDVTCQALLTLVSAR